MSSRRSCFSLGNNLLTLILYSPIALTVVGAVLGIAIYSTVVSPSSSSTSTKCSSFWVGRPIVSVGTSPLSHDASQPHNMILKSSSKHQKMFADMPSRHEKYFYAPCSKNCHPMIRALRVLGWDKVNTIEEGRLIFSYKQNDEFYEDLQPWQRFNHIPNSEAWHDLTMQTAGWKAYATKTGGNWPYFVPESYSLGDEDDRKALAMRIKSGIRENWIGIVEGEKDEEPPHITHFAANSKELIHFFKNQIGNSKEIISKGAILQSYVCNPLTWKKRKIAIRSFWMIASMDPLIVLYQDGYVRHGYADTNLFKTTRDYYEAPLPRFEEEILRPYVKGKGRKFSKDIRRQPLAHIRSQLKESIATLVDAFRSPTTFQPPKLAEDGFTYYVTDSYLDEDLNIWLAKAYNETKLPEDRYFHIETNHNIFYGMGKVLTEIWDKQANGESILPLQHGNGWQLVYAADIDTPDNKWMYQYDGYKRKKVKKSCRIQFTDKNQQIEEGEEEEQEQPEGEDMATKA